MLGKLGTPNMHPYMLMPSGTRHQPCYSPPTLMKLLFLVVDFTSHSSDCTGTDCKSRLPSHVNKMMAVMQTVISPAGINSRPCVSASHSL